jgi:ferredoxin-NADP reductase
MKRHEWRGATVVSLEQAASDMVALRVKPDEWLPHLAGQHYEIRFPGERLSRTFSIASSPAARGTIEFGLQVRPHGMLTPRLAACIAGDRLELRGPTGQAFAWEPPDGGPLVLLGAGAGITPLCSMYGSYRAAGLPDPVLFVLSVHSPHRIFRADRLPEDSFVRITERDGRIDRGYLEQVLGPVLERDDPVVRVCGPLGFMDTMVDHLLDLGISGDRIRSEAFV